MKTYPLLSEDKLREYFKYTKELESDSEEYTMYGLNLSIFTIPILEKTLNLNIY